MLDSSSSFLSDYSGQAPCFQVRGGQLLCFTRVTELVFSVFSELMNFSESRLLFCQVPGGMTSPLQCWSLWDFLTTACQPQSQAPCLQVHGGMTSSLFSVGLFRHCSSATACHQPGHPQRQHH